MSQTPREILDTMLGYLGFITEIKEIESEHGPTLMIYSSERERLIGRHGETLEDIQFLLNRVIQSIDKDAPRVCVDVEHYRQMREDQIVQRARQVADLVRKTGRPFHLDPMNSYDRWVIHNAFKDDPDVASSSPKDDSRMKRITLRRRAQQG
jgi:spoIIIJ-associated protein